jgi:DNA polymerase I-like protein with 3'-5' exonuclease and polymerase domains
MIKFNIDDADLGFLQVEYYSGEEELELQAIQTITKEKVIGYDVETTFAEEWKDDPKAGLDPWRSRLRLIQFALEDGRIFMFDFFEMADKVKDSIRDLLERPLPVKTAHNAKFDVKFARHFLGVRKFGRVFDTESGSRQISCGRNKIRISLKDAVLQFLGITISKTEQRSDWSLPVLTEEQLRYAARDPFLNLKLRAYLLEEMKRLEIIQSVAIDFDTIDPVAAMELAGFPFDPEKWEATDLLMKERRLDVIDEIYDEFRESGAVKQQAFFSSAPLGGKRKKDQIKINSPKQIQELLVLYGVEIPEKRDKKTGVVSKTTDTPNLKPIAANYKILPKLLLFRELDKRKTSYGGKYTNKYLNPATLRIHADFDPLKTKTGRFACENPNLQQIPHIEEYRSCFVARKGRKFVSADYSQIELRVAAELSGDEGFIEAFQSGADFHDATTSLMFHLPMPPQDEAERKIFDQTPEGKHFKEMRGFAKRINFGIIYGMGAKALSMQTGLHESKDTLFDELRKTGKTVEEAAEISRTTDTAQDYIDKYGRRFTRLMSYLDRVGKQTAKTGEIRTWVGRLARFTVDQRDRASRAQAERNGKNTPVQGGAGEILKIALRYIHDRVIEAENNGIVPVGSITLVNIIHDEVILEVDDIEFILNFAKDLLETAMKDAGHLLLKQVPCKVDAAITNEWKK